MKSSATNIRLYRNAFGLSQSELAVLVGVRRETICNLESGRYRPSWSMIFRISEILNVCPCELMNTHPRLCDWGAITPLYINNKEFHSPFNDKFVSTNDANDLCDLGYKMEVDNA